MKIRVSDQRLNENVLEKCDVQGISKFVRLCLQVLSRKACKTQIILFLAFVLFISSLLLFNYHKFHRHDGMKAIRPNKYPTYYDDGLRSGWHFKTTKNYHKYLLRKWSEPKVAPRKFKLKHEPGENGTGFIPPENMELYMDQLMATNNFNLLASMRISLHRSLPDIRYPECHALIYPRKLPTTSVVIVFHNEAISMLLRTIWSVAERSPLELLREIILVDDFSSIKISDKSLEEALRSFSVHVEIIRTTKREGLTRARLLGAEKAKGEVLTFLDSHVECTNGWLQPLLSRIASDRSVIAVPVIDRIRARDLAYMPYTSFFAINGIRWHLVFSNMTVPERERVRTHYDRTAPLRSPTHIGCAFSVDREFFYEIGAYDEKMDIWGTENLELALRAWLCGGALEVIPCSRIGHLFRVSTYSFGGDASLIKNRNNVRFVELWMDEFKHFFYAANPQAKFVLPGDLTERIELKKKLKCKSFRWYLEHIYPESNWLKQYSFLGEVVSVADEQCLDLHTAQLNSKLAVFVCHKQGGNQFFALADTDQLITAEELCIGVSSDKISIISVYCSEKDSSQLWTYDKENMWLVHKSSQMCMKNDKTRIILAKCDRSDIEQKWKLDASN